VLAIKPFSKSKNQFFKIVWTIIFFNLLVSACGQHDHLRKNLEPMAEKVLSKEPETPETLILQSIQSNKIEIFSSEFVKQQLSPDHQLSSGRYILHESIIWNSIEIVAFLFDRGANTALLDLEGKTAIDLAQGKANILKILKPGSSEDEILQFFTLLMKNKFQEIKKILNQGFDPNIFFENGETPLTIAIKNKSENTVRVLLQAQIKIDVNLANRQTEKPIQLAKSLGLKRVEQMLRTLGAQEDI
jgi:ankyrin repeat protein